MNTPLVRITSALALIMFTAVAEAKVYKWTDSNGYVVFSDIPPELEPENTNTEQSFSTTNDAERASLLALNARERLMSDSFSPTAWALSKNEIESAQRLDNNNAM